MWDAARIEHRIERKRNAPSFRARVSANPESRSSAAVGAIPGSVLRTAPE
jgi:hypothetical protein